MRATAIYLTLCMALLALTPEMTSAQTSKEPVVRHSVFFFESLPVREMPVVLPGAHEKEQRVVHNRFPANDTTNRKDLIHPEKPLLQKNKGTMKTKGPALNFEGVGNVTSGYPADPNGDVGLNHYVQTVNNAFGVWDKDGNLLYGPVANKTLFASFPGPWQNNPYYWCDPIFKFDQLANRWVFTCMAVTNNYQLPFYTMAAVSTTEDPLGSYYCYFFQYDYCNDYPKLSVWPDGYYITYNMFDVASCLHSMVSAFDRDAMLSGAAQVTAIEFQISNSPVGYYFPLSADMRGMNVPVGAPCYIVNAVSHDNLNPWHLSMDVYAFTADWSNPSNATLDLVSQFDLGAVEPTVNFTPGAPQPGNPINVITIPNFMMYPLTYRLFSTHEAMVCSHTLWDGEVHYIRWYELRKEDEGWYIFQTGNYAPGDLHCYYPGISINGNGDIGLGYTVSNETTYPSIHFTGRRAADPPGIMTIEEIELYKGLNYANTYQAVFEMNRWGDYSSMMVDPADDSTFWYTNMYTKATTNPGNWATRIFALNLVEEELLPVSDAGNDTLTCNVLFFTTQGQAENYSSIVWTTGGDGSFISNNALNATYLRGPGDIQNQQVTLTLHATGYYPGSVASDSMVLYLNKIPEVNAGEDVTIAPDESVSLQGEVLYAYDCMWTTDGDGIFSDSTMANAIYTPGQQDIDNGQVVLTLTACQVPPCTGCDADSLSIFILPTGIGAPLSNTMALNVFPNPVQGMAEIGCIVPGAGTLTMQVLDIAGKSIFTGRYPTQGGRFSHRMDFSLQPPGHYFIRVSTESEHKTIKIIKTH
jgi:hypothetical protein